MSALKASLQSAVMIVVLAVLSSPAQAQTALTGYGVLGSGAYSNNVASGPLGSIAGGAEVLAGGRHGGGAEIGIEGWAATVSLDGVIHLQQRATQRIVPFVRAGITHAAGEYSNTYNGPNVGAGVNLWFASHAAVRVEYLHVVQTLSGGAPWTENYNLVRFGMSFR